MDTTGAILESISLAKTRRDLAAIVAAAMNTPGPKDWHRINSAITTRWDAETLAASVVRAWNLKAQQPKNQNPKELKAW